MRIDGSLHGAASRTSSCIRSAVICGLVAASSLAFSGANASASVMFSDSTYNPADYSVAFDYIDSAVPVTSSTFAAVPGLGLKFTISTNGPNMGNGILNGVLNTTFVYNPATQGAISSISASADKFFSVTNADPLAGSVAFGNNFRPLIEQDGLFYAAAIAGPGVGPVPGGATQTFGPGTLSNPNLTLNDFFLIDPITGTITGSHGSLSFAGDPLTFGLVQLLGTANTQVFADATYTNLKIGVVSNVPLPASAPMFGVALLGLAGFGYAAKRKKAAAAH